MLLNCNQTNQQANFEAVDTKEAGEFVSEDRTITLKLRHRILIRIISHIPCNRSFVKIKQGTSVSVNRSQIQLYLPKSARFWEGKTMQTRLRESVQSRNVESDYYPLQFL